MYFSVLGSVNHCVRLLIGLLLSIMCILALFQVIVRLGLSELGITTSAPWSEELGRIMMIWMIFLGVAYAFRSGQMVALRLLSDWLPRRIRVVMEGLVAIVVVGFAVLLIKVGVQITEFGWLEKSPVLQIDKAYVYLAMPVSAALMAVNALSTFIEDTFFTRVDMSNRLDSEQGGVQ
ncbi:MAG: hypothetical protein CMM62_18540 [Rhodospirillaceae bacterium]|nr:hypothetical protein [Rhodospirillaceae bacterium]MAX62284.1 hypothetical protein [Rhodospirillaceae bacterium]